MSIIYEALKKVQTQMHPEAAAPAEQAQQPIVVDIKPEKLHPIRFQDEPETKSLFRFIMPFAIVIFTGIVWLIATLIYYSAPIQRWLHKAEPVPVLSAPQVALEPAAAAVEPPAAADNPMPATAMPPAAAAPAEQALPAAEAQQPQEQPAAAPLIATGVAEGVQPSVPAQMEAAQPAAPVQEAANQPPSAPSAPAPITLHVQGIMTQNGQSVVLINDRIYEAGDTIADIKILGISTDSLKILRNGKEETILLRR